jgi:hypothetical protein
MMAAGEAVGLCLCLAQRIRATHVRYSPCAAPLQHLHTIYSNALTRPCAAIIASCSCPSNSKLEASGCEYGHGLAPCASASAGQYSVPRCIPKSKNKQKKETRTGKKTGNSDRSATGDGDFLVIVVAGHGPWAMRVGWGHGTPLGHQQQAVGSSCAS